METKAGPEADAVSTDKLGPELPFAPNGRQLLEVDFGDGQKRGWYVDAPSGHEPMRAVISPHGRVVGAVSRRRPTGS
jgi:hypothetical protein